MPYKSNESNALIHMRRLVADHASTTLVKINQVSILQKPNHNKPDENENFFPCSTKNETSIYETKLFNFTDTFSPAIATLFVLSTLCGAIEVKVVQDRVVYHVQEDDVNKDTSTTNMKVVNFMNYDGVIKPKVASLSIEHTCTEEESASTGDIEENFAVSNADNVYEEMNIRRSKREKFRPIFFSSYTSSNFSRSYAPSAESFYSSKSQPMKEPAKEEVTLQRKHAAGSSCDKGKPEKKVVHKEGSYLPHEGHGVKGKEYFSTEKCTDFIEKLVKNLEMPKEKGLYHLHEKYGAKVKYSDTKECHDLIDELIKDQAKRKKRGWPYQLHEKHAAKRKYSSTKECDEFIKELMTDIRCCMSKKAKPSLQQEEEACASAQGYYPIEEDFMWPPTDSDDEIEKQEKDEYEELWEEMDYCLNTLALEEEKKVF